MIKLSKKTEYALLAVKYMALQDECNCITAREISDNYKIPYDILAKILQKLVKGKIIMSYQGVKGGYSLSRDAKDITLNDVISSIEKIQITDCMKDNGSIRDCARFECCQIRNPLSKVQQEIDRVFRSTTIRQIL